jgi:hypothetical protein
VEKVKADAVFSNSMMPTPYARFMVQALVIPDETFDEIDMIVYFIGKLCKPCEQ